MATNPGLLISEILTNPSGNDSPFEYVELIATQAIDFSATPYSVIFANNGTANANGWITGSETTYGFNITTGSVNAGEVVYVGGSSMTPTGIKLRTIDTATTTGDRFGNANPVGVLGNGGDNADAVAVFANNISTVTNTTVPVDAIFFGNGAGTAVVSTGTEGYELPVNDRYSGGKLQSNSFLALNPVPNQTIVASGIFDTTTNTFTTPRTWSTGSATATSGITLNQSTVTPGANSVNLSVNPNTGSETDTTAITLTATTSSAVSGDQTVNLAVTGTGITPSDYTLSSTTITIPNGQTTGTATFNVVDDVEVEGTETAILSISNPSSGITLGTTTSQNITITDNDTPAITRIYDIQGAAHTSPLVGQSVTTTGIVTAKDSNGFYLQDATGDGNNATSDAIFVFTGSAPTVTVGDALQVSGTVSEFFPGGLNTGNLSTTQISSPTITIQSSGNALPAATIIGSGGRIPPNKNIDDDAFTSFDPDTDGIDFFESLEGMLVTAKDAVAVGSTNSFGEIFTVVDNGTGATGLSDRGTLNISPDDFNPERVQINQDSGILPGFTIPQVNVGAKLGDVTGVVGYGFGNFEIYPTQAFNVTPGMLQPETTNLMGGKNKLTVASYNVLNLDPNDADGDTDVADGRFNAIATQIVTNLKAPDIIGLQEIQDNTGSTNNGVIAADQTLQQLVDAIAAAGGPTYSFIDNTFIGNNTSGGQPGGNIRTAFLYNPERVSFVKDSLSAITDASAQQTDNTNPFFDSRLPLAAKFTFNNEEVTVVNNHFSSKSGSAPILGVEQPFEARQEDVTVNGSLDERQAQAQAVKGYVDGILAVDADANVVVLGDLNEFEFVSPVTTLAQSLTNLTETLREDERYSFNFQGNSQSLDHILVSRNLTSKAAFDSVHLNSEFAETTQRASDHDPLVASLSIPKNMDIPKINLSKIGTFTGDGAEIVAHDPTTQRLFVTTGDTVEILDVSDPTKPTKFGEIDITSIGGGVNSVAVKNGIVAVAIEAKTPQDPGLVAFYNTDGVFQRSVVVGALPDMLTFTPDGTKILVANEGEPNEDYTVDPEGSISIIDISGGVAALDQTKVKTANFRAFNSQKQALIDKGVRIFGPGATVAQDLEPEYIAVSPDGTKAFVTLQENNAIAVVDLATSTVTDVLPLGYKDHSLAGNGFDASDRDVNGTNGGGGKINIQNWPVFGMYQPDSISSFQVAGKTYYLTANEGDARIRPDGDIEDDQGNVILEDGSVFNEETRINDVDVELDPTVFPNAATLKNNANLGRLTITNTRGDTDGDGDYDELYAYGARSFSIWDDQGNLVFDSGDQLERITAKQTETLFNADFDDEVLDANGNLDFSDTSPSFKKDNRSDNKGPEPEAVTVGVINGKTYGFIGLERAGGGVMVYDLSDPTEPEFIQYIRTEGDISPEGFKFISGAESPNGNPMLAVANEVSGTTTLYNIDVPPTVTNYTFDNLPKLGTTSTNQDIFLGGFSGLYFQGIAENGNLKFVTNTDRGPNGEATDGKRPFLLPSFQPEVVSFELNRSTGEIAITDRTGLFREDGTTPLTGLPNLQTGVQNTAYTDEIGVDLDGNTLSNDTLGADLEGIVVAPDGSYWMVDEYRPAIYHFDNNGKLIDRFIPQGSATDSSQNGGTSFGTPVLPAVYAQRRANRGFEAVALEGNKLYAFIQSAIDNPDDGADTASRGSRNLRILEFDTASKQVTGEYLYLLDSITGTGNAKTDKIGDAVALGNGKFAVVERDDLSTTASNKLIYSIDLAQATNINNPANFTLPAGKTIEQLTPEELTTANIKPVSKSLIANAAQSGYTGVEKLEGLALVAPNTLALINDNDFNSNVPEQLGILELPNDLPVTTNQTYTLQILHASDLEGGVDAIDKAANFAAIVDYLEDEVENSITLSAGDNYLSGPFFSAAGDQATFRDGGVFNDFYNDFYNLPQDVNNDSKADTYGSLREGSGRVDISIMNAIGFDASAFGNHEFDLGTDTIQEILAPDYRGAELSDDRWVGSQFPYLSANLDFSNSNLAGIYTSDILPTTAFESGPEESLAKKSVPKIAPATVIEENGEKIGVVGATTPLLRSISSPGNVQVLGSGNDMDALAAVLQPYIDQLINDQGVNKVVLVSHLQQIALEKELIGKLSGVDIVIAGGSDTLQADSEDVARGLNPGDTPAEDYPFVTTNKDGDTAVIVSTDGEYSYVGRLVVDFDAEGKVIADSINKNVSGAFATTEAQVKALWGDENAFGDETKGELVKKLTDAVRGVVTVKDSNIFGETDVFLEGRRGEVRTEETNLGNLTADANLAYAKEVDSSVTVSIKNGGGIRAPIGFITNDGEELPTQENGDIKEEGEISQLDIENSLRFNNELSLLTVTAAELKQILEHAVAASGGDATPGQFPQVGGIKFSFDTDNQAIQFTRDDKGNVTGVATNGDRIRSLAIVDEDGNIQDVVVENGEVVGDASREIRLVTLNFLAGGGDSYPFPFFGENRVDLTQQVIPAGEVTFARTGTEQDALAEYLVDEFADTPFAIRDVAPAEDMRIQNLAFRTDTVLAGLMEPPVLENIIIGTNVNGTTVESIDLRGLTGQATVNFTISREANFNNEVYFYKVDNITGSVGGVKVGEAGYVTAALNNRVSPVFSTSDDNTQTGSAQFTAGSIVVPVIIADGTLAEAISGAAEVYFPYLGANTDNGNFDHIKFVGDNTFGFEDLANGGDKDFNDIVIKINSIA